MLLERTNPRPAGDVHRYQWIACPFCTRAELGREFLSLEPPTGPARVVVRV